MDIQTIPSKIKGLRKLFPDSNFDIEFRVYKDEIVLRAIEFCVDNDYDDSEDEAGQDKFRSKICDKNIIKRDELINYIQ